MAIRPKARRAFLWLVLIGTETILTYLVFKKKGISQVGNWLSFNGSVILMLPPLFQLIENRKIINALKKGASGKYYNKIAPHLENARIRDFTMYKPRDLALALLGLGLISAGFGINLLSSETLNVSRASEYSDATNETNKPQAEN